MWILTQGFDWGIFNDTGNLAVVLGIGAGVVYIVASAMLRAVRIREEAALKARLIERGASAEEIERILNAGGSAKDEAC
ncbi:hypothetical protein [Mucisphaera sp.]|uniref:hypothetical protein n=1 Tax=Mucisphaera sp. TaxID=2913024 RepID=UPI003D0974A8